MNTKELEKVKLLEELAFNTWPAHIQQKYEQWVLRAANGITKRANSVWTCGSIPRYTDWLQDISEFYLQKALPVRFQVSPGSDPLLEPLLQSLGYVIEMPTLMYIAECDTVLEKLERNQSSTFQSSILEHASEEWLENFIQFEDFPMTRENIYRQIFSNIGPHKGFLQINDGSTIIGVGTAIVEREWAGFTNVAAAEDYRRQGVGSEIIRALTQWSVDHGAKQLYLQVTADNFPAQGLYEKFGFTRFYEYHYRSLTHQL